MPKAPPAGSGSLSCLFAINKPTGLVSMTLLNKLQPLLASSALFANQPLALHPNDKGPRRRKFKDTRVKLGQGGTLDPLADGVLGQSALFTAGGALEIKSKGLETNTQLTSATSAQSSARTAARRNSRSSSSAPRSTARSACSAVPPTRTTARESASRRLDGTVSRARQSRLSSQSSVDRSSRCRPCASLKYSWCPINAC